MIGTLRKLLLHLLRLFLLLAALGAMSIAIWTRFTGRVIDDWLIITTFVFSGGVLGYAKWAKWDKEVPQ